MRSVITIVSVASLLAFASTVSAQPAFSLDPAAVEARVAELTRRLPVEREQVREQVARETTVQALVNIVEAYVKDGSNKDVVGAAIEELAKYPESHRAVRCLFQVIDIRPFFAVNGDPLWSYPAAQALIRVGVPARNRILHCGVPIPEHKLHLRAYILAMIEQTDDDPRSGRLMAIARLANET